MKYLSNTSILLGGGIIAALLIIALIGPSFLPNDPFQINLTCRLQGPSTTFPFGTDHLGRCVLSRLLLGCGLSLGSALAISAAILTAGMAVGVAAGMDNGKLDFLAMRLADLLLSFPSLILTLAIIGALGPSLLSASIGICLGWWPFYARMIRGMVLSARQKEFVAAARLSGTRGLALVIRHILPQIIPPVVVLASLETGTLILVFSGLGFLGLGVQPPQPEWGAMLNEARTYIYTAPYLLIAPGSAIFVSVLGFSLLGEGLRQTLQVKETESW